jgi:DNA-binding response OmpR family regulator
MPGDESSYTGIDSERPLGAGGRQVVIVENEARADLATVLQSRGCKTFMTSSGEDALLLLITRDCDAVVIDWDLPGINGIALCRLLRTVPEYHDAFFLLVGRRASPDERQIAISAGADDFIARSACAGDIATRVMNGLARCGDGTRCARRHRAC